METVETPAQQSVAGSDSTQARLTGRHSETTRLRSRAWRIAVIYAIFATLWIYFSDHALRLLIPDPSQFIYWSVYKGVFFVIFTSIMLLLLMLRAFGAIESGYERLKSHKAEIERTNRLYSALSHVNQAIVWATNRDDLFNRFCQVLVDHGGFGMAWVGWQDPAERTLIPVAACGDGKDYVDNLLIYTDDRIEGRGPSGKAFREGLPYICNDVMKDPATEPWREKAISYNYRASAAFPIRENGKVRGILSVYANTTDFFRNKEIALLAEAAQDVSFALDNFARNEKQQQAELLAQTERDFSQAMIESMPGILYLYNARGQFLRWNRNLEKVSGYSSVEIANMNPLQFFASEDQRSLEDRIAEVFAAGESSVEAPFVAKDGTRTPYYFTGRRIQYDGVTCLVGVGIDITERLRAEQALLELNATLEHKVAERTTDLEAAVLRAEAADRIKSVFLATMSHELRTPLNSILGFTGIILQGLTGPLNQEQTKQLGMVRGSARHLLDLIKDVLDLSKIEAGQLEVRTETIDLHSSIERVVALMKPLAEIKGLALIIEAATELPDMTGDRRRLEQILINLLNNAIKFSDHGEIRLTVEILGDYQIAPQAELIKVVRMCVTDTGMGIRPADMSKLFQPFHQLDSGLSRQHEGTGLGLAICRRLVTLMGGTISAASEWAVGSEFTVIIPLHMEHRASA